MTDQQIPTRPPMDDPAAVEKCRHCQQPLEPGLGVRFNGWRWHPSCAPQPLPPPTLHVGDTVALPMGDPGTAVWRMGTVCRLERLAAAGDTQGVPSAAVVTRQPYLAEVRVDQWPHTPPTLMVWASGHDLVYIPEPSDEIIEARVAWEAL